MNFEFHAAIFDLDGTLLDTIEDLGAAMNRTLLHYGFPALPLEHHKRSIGNGVRKYAERSIPEKSLSDALLDEFTARMKKDYRENSMVLTKPFDGILPLLDKMQEKGILISVLTNKVDAFAKEMVAHYFKGYDFKLVVGEREGIPKKPNPRMANFILGNLGVTPCKAVFIGDSIYDIQTGRNAGMFTIGAAWGYQPKELLLKENPTYLLDTPFDLLNRL